MKTSIFGALFTFISLSIHYYLTSHFYAIKSGTQVSSFCNINSTFNCDAVALSPYAQFLGFPVSLWGLTTHIIMMVAFLVVLFGVSSKLKPWLSLLFSLSVLSLLATLVMGSISFLLMDNYCILCMTLYVLSLLTFIMVYKMQKKPLLQNINPLGLLQSPKILILLVLIPVSTWAYNQSQFNSNTRLKWQAKIVSNWLSDTSRVTLNNPSFSHKAKKPVLNISIFADFVCGHCQRAGLVIRDFLKLNPDTVQMDFYNFPLDSTCNPKMKAKGISCLLAKTVHCAEKVGKKGIEVHDKLFEMQNDFRRMSISSLQKSIDQVLSSYSLNLKKIKKCRKAPGTQRAIEDHVEQAVRVDLQGTPLIFVNGKKLSFVSLTLLQELHEKSK